MNREVRVGSLVTYLGKGKIPHTAIVLEVKPRGVLLLRVTRTACPNVDVLVGPAGWRR